KDVEKARVSIQRPLQELTEARNARGRRGWIWEEISLQAATLEPYRGHELGLVSIHLIIAEFHRHYAFLWCRLVIATQRWVITDLIDAALAGRQAAAASPGPESPSAEPPAEQTNLLL